MNYMIYPNNYWNKLIIIFFVNKRDCDSTLLLNVNIYLTIYKLLTMNSQLLLLIQREIFQYTTTFINADDIPPPYELLKLKEITREALQYLNEIEKTVKNLLWKGLNI